MKASYKHTNIISSDWPTLARFYQEVFGCIPVQPARDLSGNWLDRGTGIKGARISGMHLRLPGYGDNGPTLELLQYSKSLAKSPAAANREGLGHLAFEVENVQDAMVEILQNGGKKIGEVTSAEIEGAGQITFVYVADPEGNMIELQEWN